MKVTLEYIGTGELPVIAVKLYRGHLDDGFIIKLDNATPDNVIHYATFAHSLAMYFECPFEDLANQ